MTVTELELTRHVVQTQYGEIALAETGSGPALVMLHGGGPGASGVANYHQNLTALAKQFRVVHISPHGDGGARFEMARIALGN